VSSAVRPTAKLVLREREPARTLELEALAREAGVHPELVRRFVALGFLESANRHVFPRDSAALLARAVRLRRDLGLNYAGALLACELLDRIERLEERLRRHETDRPRR
jgi:hypothetical protein